MLSCDFVIFFSLSLCICSLKAKIIPNSYGKHLIIDIFQIDKLMVAYCTHTVLKNASFTK